MPYQPTATQVAVKTIQREMSAEVFELDDQVEGVVLTALAGENILAYGPPGVNKSGLAHGFNARIDGSRFGHWLFHPQLDVAKFEGLMDLGHFQRTGGDYVNKVDGVNDTVYNTNVLYFDEFDKAPAGIKAPLLTAINEHRGNWGYGWQDLDILFSMASANRELGPEDEAIVDRFLVKQHYDNLKSAESVLALLNLADTGPVVTAAPTTIAIDDLRHAVKVEVPAVTVPREVKLALVQLRERLRAEGFSPSNRRIFKCLRLLKAKAWLEGRNVVEADDIIVLRYALWEDLDSRDKVAGIVLEYAGQATKAALRLLKAVAESRAKIDGALLNDASADDVAALGGRIMGDVRELRGQLTAARAEAGSSSERLDEAEIAINELHVSIFVQCMGNSDAEARAVVAMQGGTRQAVTV